MVVLGGGAVSYERGTFAAEDGQVRVRHFGSLVASCWTILVNDTFVLADGYVIVVTWGTLAG